MAIRKRTNGTYQVEIFLRRDLVDGKHVRRVRARSFIRRKDAQQWERRQKVALQEGGFIQPATGTLNAFLDTWLAGAARLKVRARTHDQYRRILASYVRPALGGVKLAQLSTNLIEQTYATLMAPEPEGRGLSSRAARYAHSVLRLALSIAVRDRLLASNPAVGAQLPRERRTERPTLSRAQVRTFLTATQSDRLGALWNVLAFTGLRPGEALGLKWGDVDFAAGVIRVQRALENHKRDAQGRTWRLEECKTDKSRRAVPLLAETVAALARHRDAQGVERLVAGSAYDDLGFVFANPNGAPLREDVTYKTAFLPSLSRAGVPRVTLYALRHTMATLMLEAGVSLKVVSERLGHANIALTADTYSHVTAALQEQAVSQLAAYLAE